MAVSELRVLAAVFVGGAVGTVARVAFAEFAAPPDGGWPWPTFVANVVGACLLGYVTVRFAEGLPGARYTRPLLGPGLCGGLTTFSTVQVELLTMADAQRYGLALGYVCASVAVGVTAVCTGRAVARRTPVRR